MKKLCVALALLLAFQVTAYAKTNVNTNPEYYKRQLVVQGFSYNVSNFGNAIINGNKEAVDLFLKAGMNPNATFMSAPMIFLAIEKNQPEILEMLIKNGADVEKTYALYTPLNYAVVKNSLSCTEVLINNKVDVNKNYKGIMPLNLAIGQNDTKIVELLINSGAKPDEKSVRSARKAKDTNIKDLVLKAYIKDVENK